MYLNTFLHTDYPQIIASNELLSNEREASAQRVAALLEQQVPNVNEQRASSVHTKGARIPCIWILVLRMKWF